MASIMTSRLLVHHVSAAGVPLLPHNLLSSLWIHLLMKASSWSSSSPRDRVFKGLVLPQQQDEIHLKPISSKSPHLKSSLSIPVCSQHISTCPSFVPLFFCLFIYWLYLRFSIVKKKRFHLHRSTVIVYCERRVWMRKVSLWNTFNKNMKGAGNRLHGELKTNPT